MRASSLRLSRSARKSLRSEYIGWGGSQRYINTKDTKDTNRTKRSGLCVFWCPWCLRGLYLIRDRLRQRQRAAAGFPGHLRRALRRDRLDEVGQLALERLFIRH